MKDNEKLCIAINKSNVANSNKAIMFKISNSTTLNEKKLGMKRVAQKKIKKPM